MAILGLIPFVANASGAVEDFKGKPRDIEFTVGGLAGLGIIDSTAGFALLGTAAKKIINHGFVADINNQVFLETALGPVFAAGTTTFFYSLHLRWDFEKDQEWTFFALGGLGGDVTGDKLGNHWELFPRFGVGALWHMNPTLTLRGEISHELIALGVSFGF